MIKSCVARHDAVFEIFTRPPSGWLAGQEDVIPHRTRFIRAQHLTPAGQSELTFSMFYKDIVSCQHADEAKQRVSIRTTLRCQGVNALRAIRQEIGKTKLDRHV